MSRRSRPAPSRRRVLAVVGVATATVALLAGCATPASLDPAPTASAPVCAEMLLTLPETLAGADRRSTTTQSSRAWGDPAITLRCGVTPPGPTTDRCITVDDGEESIDWVVADLGGEQSGGGSWTFTTYGRSPAVEVVVPVEHAGEDATSLLLDLGSSVALIPAERACIGLE